MTVPLFARSGHATAAAADPNPAQWTTGTRLTVELVERTGFRAVGEALTAEVDEVTENLTGVDGASGNWSAFDRLLAGRRLDSVGSLLLRISMDGEPIMACPLFDTDVDETGHLRPDLVSEKVWFTKRRFGRANRPNQYGYGAFDPDDPGHRWYGANCAPVVVTDPALVPDGLTLRIPAPVDWGAGAYATNLTWAVPHQFTPGIVYVAVHYLRQDIARTFVDSVLELRRYASLAEAEAGHALDVQTVKLDEIDDPVDGWHRVALGIWIPPGPPSLLETRLMAPDSGHADWGGGDPAGDGSDGYRLNRDEAFATLEAGQDAAVVFGRAVDYMQDPGQGKSDLGLGTYVVPGTAANVVISEPHHLHREVGEFVAEKLQNIEGGIDWGIRYLRHGELAYTGTPRLGAHLADRPICADRWLNIRFKVQGTEVGTDVVELGDHSEFFGEEGTASDRTGTGGVVVDVTHQAPKGTPWPQLDSVAGRRLQLIKDVPYTVETDAPIAEWWWVHVGDTADARHTVGNVELSGTHRVQRKRLRPRDGLVTVEWAPIDFGKDLADAEVRPLRHRVAQLEANPDPMARRRFGSAPFSLPFDLVDVDVLDSGVFAYPNPGAVTRVLFEAKGGAADVDLPITVTVDGATRVVTIPAGQATMEQPVPAMPFGKPGRLSLSIDATAATAGGNLSVNLVVREQDV